MLSSKSPLRQLDTPPAQSPLQLSFNTKNSLSKIADLLVYCDPDTSILNASLLMKEKRTHCLLIIDQNNGKLVGLTTTKDLAFKAVANNLNPATCISQIMTKNPYYVSHLTTPNAALKLMVEKKIRHLPIVDENEVVLGILNITTCFYNAMIRLERISEKSRELQLAYNDLKEINIVDGSHYDCINTKKDTIPSNNPSIKIKNESKSLGNFKASAGIDLLALNEGLMDLHISRRKNKIRDELKSLIAIMKQPDLKSLLEDNELTSRKPFYVDAKTSILDASQLLLKNNITAALIVRNLNDVNGKNKSHDSNDFENIIGILTTKDLVFRVLALNINPEKFKVVRVMTSKPEFATDSMAIHSALRLMFEGKYLNLPIKNKDQNVTGLVNVFDLTYALLNILNDNTSDLNSDSMERNSNRNNHYHDNHKDNEMRNNSYSGTDTTNSDDNFHAWNKFWDTLDRPLYQITNSSKRSYSLTGRKSSSLVNISPQHKTNSSPDSGFVKSNTESAYSVISKNEGSNSKTLRDNQPDITFQRTEVKVQVSDNLNLGLDGNVYKFDLQEGAMIDSIFSALEKKVLQLDSDCEKIFFHLGYFDDDKYLITLDTDEELKNLLLSNSNASLIINIRKHNEKKSWSTFQIVEAENKKYIQICIPLSFTTFPKFLHRITTSVLASTAADRYNGIKTTSCIFLGGLSIILLVFHRFMIVSKK